MTSIFNLGKVNETVLAGCLSKSTPEAACGTRMTIHGDTIAICCCKDHDNCNDEAFIAKCKAGTTPTTRPKGFTCVGKQPKSIIENYIKCSGI